MPLVQTGRKRARSVKHSAEDISVSGFVDEANRYVVNVCAEKIGNARW
jgi:hypothetical protein